MCSTESRSACCCSSDWGLLSAHALAPPTVVAQCGESWRDLPARSFWFRAADHARLHGVELGAGTAGVVLAHENNGSLCEWLGTAKTLAEDGYHVLALDFRGFGLSPLSSHPSRLPSDLVGASGELRRRGARSVVLVGGSIGGTAVLLAAPRVRPIVAGAVCVSCVGNLADYVGGSQTQYDAARAMPNLRAALLIMGATDDPIVDLPLYRRLIRLAATHDKALALFPGGAHGARLFDSTVSGPAATTRLLEFLARHPQIGSIGGWTGGCSAPGIGSV